MQAEWRNAARTILALTEDSGHVIIVEPGHALWPEAYARPDIAPFVAEPVPELTPEDIRAAIPPLTRRQVFIALHRLGLISAAESVAAAAIGAVPAALEPLFTVALRSSLARKALGLSLATVTIVLFVLNLRRAGERAGRLAERHSTSEKIHEIQRQMLEAASRRPINRNALAERLRDGRF